MPSMFRWMPKTWHGRRDKRPVPTDFSESLRHLQREPINIILMHPLRPQPVIVLSDTVDAVALSTTPKDFPMNGEIPLNVVVIDDETVSASVVVVPMVAGASRPGAKWSVDG